MPSAFPGALDAYADPGAAVVQGLSSPTHSVHHQNHNDAVEAIEAHLGATPGVNDRMTHVRIGDAAGKGLWVPISAVAAVPLTLNGNYDAWQRGTGARTCPTTYSSDTSYSADRLFTLPAGASVTTQQSGTVPDNRSQFSLQITGAASVTTVDHGQRIRSSIVGTRGRQPLVFSAYVQNLSGAAFTPNLRIGTPGGVDAFGTVTNRLDQALQSCPDSAWTLVHHVFDPSAYTNITNGLEVALRVPSGSLVSGDTVRIAAFDLRPGTQFRAFTPPDPDAAIWECYPYYQAIAANAVNYAFANGTTITSVVVDWPMAYLRPMRTPPTVTYGSAVTDFQAYGMHGLAVATGMSTLQVGLDRFNGRITVSGGLTPGYACQLTAVNGNAVIRLNAEL